jgi:hypothetical protein
MSDPEPEVRKLAEWASKRCLWRGCNRVHDGAEEGWFKGSLEDLLSAPGTEISWTLCPQHGLALKGELEQFTYLDAEIESDE